jgi:hypothetical protein
MDSTTISLVANCMPWAKHRRKKAAVKCHLSLNLQNHLPQAICVEEACHTTTASPGSSATPAGRLDRGGGQGLRPTSATSAN